MQTEKQTLANGEQVESRAGNLEKRDEQLMEQIRQWQKEKQKKPLNMIKRMFIKFM